MKIKFKASDFLLTAAVFLVAGFGFSNSAKAVVIFEDDFSNPAVASGWTAPRTNVWTTTNAPTATNGTKWTAFRNPGATYTNSVLQIVPSAGKGGNKPALKFSYTYGDSWGSGGQGTGTTSECSQPSAVILAKHLTGDKDTGYNELYIRYVVKFDDAWQVGDGSWNSNTDAQSWKWFRLHQHRYPTNVNWSETILSPDTGLEDAITNVSNWNGVGRENLGMTANPNHFDGGSSAPIIRIDHSSQYASSATNAHLGSMGWNNGPGEWETQGPTDPNPGYFKCYPNCNQGWHAIEWHIKHSTIDQPGNGIFEVWFDGVKQDSPWEVHNTGGLSGWTAYPTKTYNPNNVPDPDGSGPLVGGGINFIYFFDNIQAWTCNWAAQKFIYIDSYVVSTAPIGTNYKVGGGTSDTTPPIAPQGLAVQ